MIDGEKIIAAGFFKNESSAYGSFMKIINTTSKEVVSDIKLFSKEMSKMLYCSNPVPDHKYYKIAAVELKKADNSYYLLGEERARLFYSLSSGSEKNRYDYFNTIVVKFSTEKKIDWIKPIPKMIFSYNTFDINSPHFLSFISKGELKLIHLQHSLDKDLNIDNYDINQVKSIMGSNGCDAVLYSFNASGMVKTQILIDKIDNGFSIQPCVPDSKYFIDNIFYSNKNTNVIFFNKGKNSRFAFID